MAFNTNTYNNNANYQNANKWNPSVTSPYRMNNGDSTIDPTCITFNMWNSTLRISICPRKESAEEYASFDVSNGISIYLNHTKARLFAEEIKLFLQDPDRFTGSGVMDNKNNLITISNGAEFGADSPMIIIRHLDENGNPVSSFGYQVRHGYHSVIRNYSGDGDNCSKVDNEYNDMDILDLLTMLEEYYRNMTYATAFTVMDANKTNWSKLDGRIYNIAQKLGVDVSGNSNGGTRTIGSSSYGFSQSATYGTSNPSYRASSLDEFE